MKRVNPPIGEIECNGELDTEELSQHIQDFINSQCEGPEIKKTTTQKIDKYNNLITWEYQNGETFSVTVCTNTQEGGGVMYCSDNGPLVNTKYTIYRNPVTKAFKNFFSFLKSLKNK